MWKSRGVRHGDSRIAGIRGIGGIGGIRRKIIILGRKKCVK